VVLKEKLHELFIAMAGGDHQPPLPDQVVIAELGQQQFDALGRPDIVSTDLRTPAEYEVRFSELLTSHLPWINLSYYGLLDGKGLVVVEIPNQRHATVQAATSINYSGPPSEVAAAGWDARAGVVVR
jgi:hypothetical protein